MKEVILYSTNCPKCRVLESKLKDRNIQFTKFTNIEEMRKMGYINMPKLKVDDKLYEFMEAIDWINKI